MKSWKRIAFIAGPLAFAVALLSGVGADAPEQRVAAVALWVLIWWLSETVPIFITAMLPMVLFPALGIMSVPDTFAPYGSSIIFLFLGGFIIALGLEQWRLHERIALFLIRLTGASLSGITLGFILATGLISMWISNTATAVMMLPIATSVFAMVGAQLSVEMSRKFSLVLLLSVAYAASIGGTMTLVGTPPNMVFAGFYADHAGREFGFTEWMAVGVPFGAIMLILLYILLTKLMLPLGGARVEGLKEMIEFRTSELGPLKTGEKRVIAIFAFTVACWFFVNPINALAGFSVLNNASIAITGGLLMFLTPSGGFGGPTLLQWESTQRIPWGILILFGGGLCIANGLENAGLFDLVVSRASSFSNHGVLVICLVLTVSALLLTEVMSNVALVTVLLPVVFSLADALGVPGQFFAIPVTLAASCAFMMPISTPPNAVVYSTGLVSIRVMMKAGIWMNLFAVVVIMLLALVML